MIGMQVSTDSGEDFGVLKDVLTTGANDVYVIQSVNKDRSQYLVSVPLINRYLFP